MIRPTRNNFSANTQVPQVEPISFFLFWVLLLFEPADLICPDFPEVPEAGRVEISRYSKAVVYRYGHTKPFVRRHSLETDSLQSRIDGM